MLLERDYVTKNFGNQQKKTKEITNEIVLDISNTPPRVERVWLIAHPLWSHGLLRVNRNLDHYKKVK
jgi:hypothetical protein